MLAEDIYVGMRVRPISRTLYYRQTQHYQQRNLEASVVWKRAKHLGQDYLVVSHIDEETGKCLCGLELDRDSGDWFFDFDLEEYVC